MIEKGQLKAVLIVLGSLGGLLVLLFATVLVGARSDGGGPPAAKWRGADQRLGRVVNVADYRTETRSDSEAIQAAIDAANPGDTVFFPGGTYKIDKPFMFASGVNHIGDSKTPAVLLGVGETSLLIHHDAAAPLRDTTIQRLHFNNIELRLSGDATYSSFKDVTLKDCVFENGRRKDPWASDYVWLRYTSGVTIDGCTFLRNSQSGGRGVVLERTRMSVIKDSFFGTTRNLEPGAPNGYFKTAINLTGYDGENGHRNEDVVVDGNVWRRADNISCPGLACEDHGLYAWGVKGLAVTRNYADGWTNTATGGSVKIRNGEDIVVAGNRFLGSAIIGTTHWHDQPRHLRRVLIKDNFIDLRGDKNPAMGITYRRSDAAASPTRYCSASGGEDDIFIIGNHFVNGGAINLQCANGREICVANNRNAAHRFHVAYVRVTDCLPPPSWSRRVGGVHRGDFNSDGKEDFIYRVRSATSDAYHWRAHLSEGDGYAHEDWGDGFAVAPDTGIHGVHVGDFDGDGRDDVTYWGSCGSAAESCWRVHESSGTSFRKPRNYGSHGRFSAETSRFGLHTGDFDGDGRDDIVFRGLCGDDAHPCWTVLTSQADGTFAAQDWGDDARWSSDTDAYGLLVGDFNGDHRDDIAYRGMCTETRPCMRVHLSTPEGHFVAGDWADAFYPDDVYSPHFGMRVGDFNGDGKADIAYRGRCGSPGIPQWRYHMGASKPPFTIACSDDYGR